MWLKRSMPCRRFIWLFHSFDSAGIGGGRVLLYSRSRVKKDVVTEKKDIPQKIPGLGAAGGKQQAGTGRRQCLEEFLKGVEVQDEWERRGQAEPTTKDSKEPGFCAADNGKPLRVEHITVGPSTAAITTLMPVS